MKPSVALQYLLPHRFLSRLASYAASWRWRPWKDWFIGLVVRRFDVDMAEAAQPDPRAYPSFNAFFTRALKPGARVADADSSALLMPADGKISQAGPIEAGNLFQAKGHSFSAAELLGDETAAALFADGSFATIYLSPRDYHRVHMPIAGELVETVHVPGRIFGVAPFAVEAIPRLFARNERLVCHFENALGPFAVVLVGAMLVSGVATVWDGVAIPPYASSIVRKSWRGRGIWLKRGAEMGRFEMGSTVIVLLPAKLGRISAQLAPGQVVKMGQKIGAMSERISR